MLSDAELERQADMRGPAVIVTGGVIGGFTFYGPFDSIDAALKHWETTMFGRLKMNVTIALLEKPQAMPLIESEAKHA